MRHEGLTARCVFSAMAAFLCAMVSSGPALGQDCTDCVTEVPGGSIVGETWTKANSPYCIMGDVFISELTIEPGVCVLIDGPWTLTIQTRIFARGTEEEPIVFTAKDPDVSKWKGMEFIQTVPGSVLRYCKFSHASNSAIKLVDTAPTIDQCTFESNTSATSGGAILFLGQVDELLITGSDFLNNTANHHGGALAARLDSGVLQLRDCRFWSNANNIPTQDGSFFGGAVFIDGAAEIVLCAFRNNHARGQAPSDQWNQGSGGGLFAKNGTLTIEGCHFQDNRAACFDNGRRNFPAARGGGMLVAAGGEAVVIKNTIFSGGILDAATEESGGGIYVLSGNVSLENVTIARNERAGLHVADGDVEVRNSILWENNGSGVQIIGPVCVNYSCVQNGFEDDDCSDNNIPFNPAFAGAGTTVCELTILDGSPCIDAGDFRSMFDDSEDCSDPPYGKVRNDMGAHGGPGACWTLPPPLCCPSPANLNCDCTVDADDFFAYLDGFAAGDLDVCDMDGDGDCDADDFFRYLDLFMLGC